MSDTTTIAPVESHETPAPVSLDTLDSKQLSHWRQTGDLPETPDTSTEAASSPAEPAAQATSTDAHTPPASEPGTPKKNNAETRIKELLAENARLKAESESFRARPPAPETHAASSPAPQAEVTLSAAIESPDLSKPMLEETEFFSAFQQATVKDYMRYVARYENSAADIARQSRQSFESRQQWFDSEISKAVDTYPDIQAKVPEELRSAAPVELLPPGVKPVLSNYVMQEVWTAPDPGKLLLHIAESAEAQKEIQASRTPADVIRTIARIQARLGTPSVPPKPVVKTTTSAPPPPPTLGSKPAIPGDAVEEALASGDVGKYIREMNRREMAGQL